MTEEAWRESATTDVVFPDDVAGYGPLCVVGAPVPAEEADTTTVEFGTVAELAEDHPEQYLVAPRALRELIADAWRADEGMAVFEVESAEKAGPADDAPYEIEGRIIEDGDPF